MRDVIIDHCHHVIKARAALNSVNVTSYATDIHFIANQKCENWDQVQC